TSLPRQARPRRVLRIRLRTERRSGVKPFPFSCPERSLSRSYRGMESSVTGNSGETDQLLRRVSQGDRQEWGALLERHRQRLRRMIALRLDQRLQGRIDASDVIQETYLEASIRLEDYLRQPTMPFFLWLRFLTGQKLVELHRHHLGAQMRDAGREVSLYRGSLPATSSAALAA